MKNLHKGLLLLNLIVFVSGLNAQTLTISQNNNSGIYKSGDAIKYTLYSKNELADSVRIKVFENNHHILLDKKVKVSTDSLRVFESVIKKPCSIVIEAKIGKEKYTIGSVVDPHLILPGSDAPDDLESYWKNEKKVLAKTKPVVLQKPVESNDEIIVCFDTEISCPDFNPARAYFAKPVKAVKKSLPIVIVFHAAGVKGSWCKSNISEAVRYAKMGNGALVFDLNAHGMLNGMPEDYYNKLETGDLKDYYMQGVENRGGFYLRGMYLRLLRSIDFMASQPEWDGKRILVIGESQGGGQAFAAAGLDKRVTAVVATVPAMCDWSATLINRKGGWPMYYERNFDKSTLNKTVSYFDTAFLLKNSKAKIVVEIGLADNVCSSTSIYAAVNQAKGEKIIYPVTYREHSWPNDVQRKNHWDDEVHNPKNDFISSYLK